MEISICVRRASGTNEREIVMLVRPFWFCPFLQSAAVLNIEDIQRIMSALYKALKFYQGKTNG